MVYLQIEIACYHAWKIFSAPKLAIRNVIAQFYLWIITYSIPQQKTVFSSPERISQHVYLHWN